MSPIVLLVFAPVMIGGLAFVALFLGAATAGVWETFEERVRRVPRPQGRRIRRLCPKRKSSPGRLERRVIPSEQSAGDRLAPGSAFLRYGSPYLTRRPAKPSEAPSPRQKAHLSRFFAGPSPESTRRGYAILKARQEIGKGRCRRRKKRI